MLPFKMYPETFPTKLGKTLRPCFSTWLQPFELTFENFLQPVQQATSDKRVWEKTYCCGPFTLKALNIESGQKEARCF